MIMAFGFCESDQVTATNRTERREPHKVTTYAPGTFELARSCIIIREGWRGTGGVGVEGTDAGADVHH